MKYDCGCTTGWKTFYPDPAHEPGEICAYHAAWVMFAERIGRTMADLKIDPDLIATDCNPERKEVLALLAEARDRCLDFSTPEEPEPPDTEEDDEDRDRRHREARGE